MIKTSDLDQFLQSAPWRKFQQDLGSRTIEINGDFFIEKPLLGQKKYLYGPKIKSSSFDFIDAISDKQTVFVRFEPVAALATSGGAAALAADPRIARTLDVQPSQTLVLDLRLAEAELLKNFHSKTRYNLRLAEKKGVRIFNDNSRIEEFIKLLKLTTERDKFKSHGYGYYRALAKTDPEFVKLFLAEYQGRIIAGGLFCFYGNCATYLHGASSNADRQVMAPHLLQWHLIKTARDSGYKYYDFYGIDAKKWPGVTRFKTGWGGEVLSYPGTFDYALDKKFYAFYKFFRKLRRLI